MLNSALDGTRTEGGSSTVAEEDKGELTPESAWPTPDEMRVIAAAFLHVRIGELIPHLHDVISNSSIARTKYLARCPACDHPTFSFGQLLPIGTSYQVSFDSTRSTSNNSFSSFNPSSREMLVG